ncbi:MAG: hypothetical protein JWP85_2171 [Rhodoglobus sp.]|nr:hypothetical protein [Rhodoglobus sp.]
MDMTLFGSVAFGLAILGVVAATIMGLSDAVARRREERYLKRTGRS